MSAVHLAVPGRGVHERLRVAFAAVLVAVPVLIALVGPFFAGFGPAESQRPFGPSVASPLGTDRLGRDVLVAALTGGRSLVVVTGITVVATYAVGFVLGMAAAATRHQVVEDVIMRPLDVLLCLPSLLIIIVAALHGRGSSIAVACAVGVAMLAPITRFVRMAARPIVHGPMMEALLMQGASWWTRYVRVGLRALVRPVLADLGVRISAMIYILASANFLGLGFDTTTTDWAVAVAANKDGLLISPASVLLPAALIVSLVLGINLIWDALAGDPRSAAVRHALAHAQLEDAEKDPAPVEAASLTPDPGRTA